MEQPAAPADAIRTAFDQRDFRDALGRFATGITVITAKGPKGKPEGLTANSFSAVSLEPPLILWCLGKQATSRQAFEACSHFTVNVLEAGQRALSHRFATPAEDKFAGLDWSPGLGGAPVFPDCLARFECRNTHCHDGGDHLILIGRVERYSHRRGAPLLFNAGKYGIAAAHPDDHGGAADSSDFEDLLL